MSFNDLSGASEWLLGVVVKNSRRRRLPILLSLFCGGVGGGKKEWPLPHFRIPPSYRRSARSLCSLVRPVGAPVNGRPVRQLGLVLPADTLQRQINGGRIAINYSDSAEFVGTVDGVEWDG